MENISTIGRYRIDNLLASGAMGDVYRAYDPVIDRPVAIKILRRELAGGGDFEAWIQRFRREAQTAGRRFHPNIVTILDFGDEAGTPFLAMEYIEGQDLGNLLKETGPLEPGRAVPIILQVLEALGFTHAHGIVHRDIKPSNIMVLDNWHVKVADFGIARIDTSEMTIVGDVLGTPAYMSPEQLWGAPVDRRADLFAVGVVLFEILTGVKPFRGKSVTEIIEHMQTRGPEDLLIHVPGAPPILKEVIARALAFNPEDRFSSAAEFTHALVEARLLDSDQRPSSDPGDQSLLAASPTPEPTQPLYGPTPTAERLAEIELDLTRIIGPIARIAVQRAVKSSGGMEQLHLRLATYIDNEAERAAFLRRGQERVNTAASSTPASLVPRQSDQRYTGLSISLAPDLLSQIEASLTHFVGPIARVLVRQQLSKSASLIDFYSELASYIPDERDRAKFLRSRPSA
jgi:serine/threonine-protein kinase